MSKTDNLHDFFTDLATAIRTREGSSELIFPRDMARRVVALTGGAIETSPRQTLKATLIDIANAIRIAEGSSSLINPQDMSDRIMAIVSIKPYLEVEYIESTGTQFIDTGVVLTSNHSVEIDYQLTEATQNRKGLFGGLFDGSLRYGMLLSPSNNYLEFGYGSGNTYWQFGFPDTNRHIMKQERNEVYFDGELLYTFKEGIFAVNKSAPLGNFAYTNYNPAKARYYSAKIWEGNKLIRDFIPALDSGGVVCWYDKVSNKFFYNQGSGAFLHGKILNEYTPVEYLEADGTQWIDTGLLSSNKSQVDVVFSFSSMAQAASNNVAIFGGRDAQTSRTFTLFKIASTNPQYLRFDYNGQRQVATSNQMTWDASHKYRFVYNGVVYETTNLTTGEVVSVNLAPSDLANSCPISLFAVNTLGTRGTFMKGRIYRYTYTDGVSSIDLIPALDKKGVPCMYDTISGRLFYNQGTGDFLVGQSYKELEYIESTGAQWIDTGILPTTATDFEFVGAITETTKTSWIVGAPTWYGIHKKVATVAATQWSNGMTYMPIEANEVFKISVFGDKAYFNDVETNSLTRKNATKSLFMFAYHHTDDTGTICSSVRMCSFKMWNQGILVRDFIPVLDKDDVACMYDKVSGEFFYNSGTREFIAGDIKK